MIGHEYGHIAELNRLDDRTGYPLQVSILGLLKYRHASLVVSLVVRSANTRFVSPSEP